MLHNTFITLILFVISVANAGKLNCSMNATSPICYSNGHVYPNFCLAEADLFEPTEWSNCDCSEINETCIDDKVHVCGSDGNTYISRCDLLTASCKINGVLFETNDQPPTCKEQDCPEMAIQPVCSSPVGIQYEFLNNEQRATFFKPYANPCLVGKDKKLKIDPTIYCLAEMKPQNCTSKENVCGNNMKIYENRCTLIYWAVKLNKKIFEVPIDNCCKANDVSSLCS